MTLVDNKIAELQEQNEEIEQLEFDLYSHMRNFRKVNNYRWRIEEVEREIEKNKTRKGDPHNNNFVFLDAKKNNIIAEMEKSRCYQDYKRIDEMVSTLNYEDRLLLSDKFFYRESYQKIGDRYKYDKVIIYRKVKAILLKLVKCQHVTSE